MNLELAIQQLFIKNGWKLSVAESCTGGALSAALTQVPGTSEYFLGGIVAYSNLLKQKYLHVFESILLASGAVSKETVQAMVQGLISTSSADFGIAISGIAGPSGGTPEKPVGTVWISVMHKGSSPQSQCLQLKGSRKEIIEDSVKSALEFLYSYAKDHDTYLQDKKEN